MGIDGPILILRTVAAVGWISMNRIGRQLKKIDTAPHALGRAGRSDANRAVEGHSQQREQAGLCQPAALRNPPGDRGAAVSDPRELTAPTTRRRRFVRQQTMPNPEATTSAAPRRLGAGTGDGPREGREYGGQWWESDRCSPPPRGNARALPRILIHACDPTGRTDRTRHASRGAQTRQQRRAARQHAQGDERW